MPVSLWLRPEPEIAARLDAAIAGYAISHGRMRFAAHVTLASGLEADENAISVMCRKFKSLQLTPDGLLEADTFFQAFAIRLGTDPTWEALKASALACLSETRLGEYPPHLSLTYGEIEDRDPLRALADIFSAPIRFDRIRLVRYDTLEATQAGVGAWQYGADMPLKG